MHSADAHWNDVTPRASSDKVGMQTRTSFRAPGAKRASALMEGQLATNPQYERLGACPLPPSFSGLRN